MEPGWLNQTGRILFGGVLSTLTCSLVETTENVCVQCGCQSHGMDMKPWAGISPAFMGKVNSTAFVPPKHLISRFTLR